MRTTGPTMPKPARADAYPNLDAFRTGNTRGDATLRRAAIGMLRQRRRRMQWNVIGACVSDLSTTITEFIEMNFVPDGAVLDPSAPFEESGLLDSAATLELVLYLEERFEISVRDEEVTPENLGSVQAVVRYLERKQTGALVGGVNGTR